MPMTITDKILAKHAGLEEVKPGQLVDAEVDLILMNDITGPPAIAEIERYKAGVFDPNKVVLVNDHSCPNKDIKSAELAKVMRDFARKHRTLFYENAGIEHALLPEEGLVCPGNVVIGADSHTCTYGALGAFSTGVGSTDAAAAIVSGKTWFKVPESMKFIYRGKMGKWVSGKDLILYTIGRIGVDGATYRAMEFVFEDDLHLPMDERFAMCNMAVEAGAKNGIIAPDQTTRDFCVRTLRRFVGRNYASDSDARYSNVMEFDVSEIEPQVAYPPLPSNVKPISEAEAERIEIDQVVIGSCTNGRLDDLRKMAKVLRGRKVHNYVRLLVFPATQKIYRQAMDEGILDVVVEAGGYVSGPTCGPCLGGHMGVLAAGERCIATTNRNFVGRMGHTKSAVFLSNPAVAAASAVKGYICSPEALG